MTKITSHIAKELYKVEIKSASGNTLIADEPVENGGKNLGFSPHELLISALAACTNATLRMYADRKQWDLQEVKTNIDLLADESGQKTILNRQIELIGNLSNEQKERLMTVANKCPIHKALSNPIEINTTEV